MRPETRYAKTGRDTSPTRSWAQAAPMSCSSPSGDTTSKHRGREVKTTGDGFLATFDDPARAIRCPGEWHLFRVAS